MDDLAIQLLAAEYAGHCLTQMPQNSTPEEETEMLYYAYNDMRQKLTEFHQTLPPAQVTAF
jgi:hypothetical protein